MPTDPSKPIVYDPPPDPPAENRLALDAPAANQERDAAVDDDDDR